MKYLLSHTNDDYWAVIAFTRNFGKLATKRYKRKGNAIKAFQKAYPGQLLHLHIPNKYL